MPVSVFHREATKYVTSGAGCGPAWVSSAGCSSCSSSELCLAFRGAFLLRQLSRDADIAGSLQGFFYLVTLQFIPYGLPLACRRSARASACSRSAPSGSSRRSWITHTARPTRTSPRRAIYQKRFLARGRAPSRSMAGPAYRCCCAASRSSSSNLTAVGHGRRRRWFVRQAPRAIRRAGRRRYPELHRRPGGRRSRSWPSSSSTASRSPS